MDSKDLSYPSDFPSGVPPIEAKSTEGIAYRVVTCDPPAPKDFCGYYKEPFKKDIPKKPKANFFGTSMFRKYERVKVARDLYKNLRGKLIAKGELNSEFGVMSPEREDSHFDAWLKENCGIEKKFTVVSN